MRDVVGIVDLVGDHHEPDGRLPVVQPEDEGVRVRVPLRLGERVGDAADEGPLRTRDAERLERRAVLLGERSEHDVAVGPNVKPFETPPALIDMAPTIVAALDAPTAVKPSGRVLHEIVGAAELKARQATETSSAGAAIPGMGNEAQVTDTEADEMEEHLRGLGYIE